MQEKIRLTQTVKKGGCAAKVPAQALRDILAQVKLPPRDRRLLVDGSTFDDAAIYLASDDLALVQTLDFFTPIVDTPRYFGRISAANSISDVYAMGGRPKTCMAILAFPLATMSDEIIVEILQGAADIIEEAKANFVGGHSIDDDTLKFGLSVTGFVNRDEQWTNSGARTGDVLILTKPIGTGTMMAGLKNNSYSESEVHEAIQSMSTLNNVIDYLTDEQRSSIRAATDITGFGVSGHAYQMAEASSATLQINTADIPLFDLTKDSLERKNLTRAHRTNHEYTEAHIQTEALSDIERMVIHDPQTSGPLLLAVESSAAGQILSSLNSAFPKAQIIGEVTESQDARVIFS